MRVIAGLFRGRHLHAPQGTHTRPVTDRVKESIFNILGSRFGTPGGLPDFEVLDLFAGTGGLGIEAVSRGAASCIFVEKDRRTLPVLRENLTQLDRPQALQIVAENAWTGLLPLAKASDGYGLIFVDPPYRDARDGPRLRGLLQRLSSRLSGEGVILLRVESRTELPLHELQDLRCVDDRKYGGMRLVCLMRTRAVEAGRINETA